MQHFEYEWKSYDELSKDELYAILRLRQEVFIVGQKINYVDCDNVDQNSHHLMTLNDDKLVGYLRMIPPGHKYENACAFGRLAVVQDYRGQGISKNMLLSCIEKCETLYPDSPLKMSAQYYLLDYYNKFGFEACTEVYIEEGIDHIGMTRSPKRLSYNQTCNASALKVG